ncbi:hypothetical protein CDAR_422311 [Caerostris darwini]|uniref:Uncharacterized protein n=1 Tax=Caerostris darwini TaxID=1538125 RepID=A0AAV4WUV9_9ARAC|nr:hypothetical protein CDAR_422311 [Caerostris darwini]
MRIRHQIFIKNGFRTATVANVFMACRTINCPESGLNEGRALQLRPWCPMIGLSHYFDRRPSSILWQSKQAVGGRGRKVLDKMTVGKRESVEIVFLWLYLFGTIKSEES